MKRWLLLIALLALCALPASATPEPLDVVWLQGNAAGQYAYLTMRDNVLELMALGGAENTITTVWVDSAPSQIAVSACGQRVYAVAVIADEAVPLDFEIGFALPCGNGGMTLWLPEVSRGN